jgi:CxxC-x17-CxxC domain-containing protein
MDFDDRTITCRDCGTQFVFTAGEQAFYQQKGFSNEPTRCPSCRRAKKEAGGGGGGGGGFRSSGGDSYGGGRAGGGGGGGGGGNRQLYKAVCSSCGVETQVPFPPSPDRPVYCRNCYNSRRGGGY